MTCVYEFKTTGRDLEPHREQLFHYVEALEAEIDEIVYDLFELTDEERQVIEDFLEVF